MFKIISLLKRTRLLISGGGSLLQDVTSTQSYKYYSFVKEKDLYTGTAELNEIENEAEAEKLRHTDGE